MTTTTTTIAMDGLMSRAPNAISAPASLLAGLRELNGDELALIVGGNLPVGRRHFIHAVEKGAAAGEEMGAEFAARTGDPVEAVTEPLAGAAAGADVAAFKFFGKSGR